MPRTCSTCSHPDRPTIDAALVAGEAFRNIAERFGLSATGVFRHNADHVPTSLAKAHEAQEVAQADDLLAQVRMLQRRATGILDTAEHTGDLRVALLAIRETRGCLELLAKLLGELDERPQVNVLIAPEWHQLVGALRRILQPHPVILAEVSAALVALEGGRSVRPA